MVSSVVTGLGKTILGSSKDTVLFLSNKFVDFPSLGMNGLPIYVHTFGRNINFLFMTRLLSFVFLLGLCLKPPQKYFATFSGLWILIIPERCPVKNLMLICNKGNVQLCCHVHSINLLLLLVTHL